MRLSLFVAALLVTAFPAAWTEKNGTIRSVSGTFPQKFAISTADQLVSANSFFAVEFSGQVSSSGILLLSYSAVTVDPMQARRFRFFSRRMILILRKPVFLFSQACLDNYRLGYFLDQSCSYSPAISSKFQTVISREVPAGLFRLQTVIEAVVSQGVSIRQFRASLEWVPTVVPASAVQTASSMIQEAGSCSFTTSSSTLPPDSLLSFTCLGAEAAQLIKIRIRSSSSPTARGHL